MDRINRRIVDLNLKSFVIKLSISRWDVLIRKERLLEGYLKIVLFVFYKRYF